MTSSSSFLVAEWPLPSIATLGSSVRAFGLEREVRRRLPWKARKHVHVQGQHVVLRMPDEDRDQFAIHSATVTRILEGIAACPVLPSEVEDILGISPRERHKWMKAGRLQSAGTRTVKMRGRAKAVTFHVFTPQHIEDVLDRDLPTVWREEDAAAISENRRRAAANARLGRDRKKETKSDQATSEDDDPGAELEGWEAFAATGLLR